MKYFEVEFIINPMSDDASDLLAALAGDAGFETLRRPKTDLRDMFSRVFSTKMLCAVVLPISPLRAPV